MLWRGDVVGTVYCTRYKNAVTMELFVDCSIGMYEIHGNKRDLERAVPVRG